MIASDTRHLRSTTRFLLLVAAVCLLLVGGGFNAALSAPAHVKVTICHRTNSVSNPYNKITVNLRAVDGDGHSDHQGHLEGGIFDPTRDYPSNRKDWGDIIPPFDRNGDPITDPSFPGSLNWTRWGRLSSRTGTARSSATTLSRLATALSRLSSTSLRPGHRVDDHGHELGQRRRD